MPRSKTKTKKPAKPSAELTEKERRFVELYMGECVGNGTESCRRAGFEGSDDTLAAKASRLIRKDKVRQAIDERRAADPRIATRKERQRFWTEAMDGKVGRAKVGMKERLRASELLGKSQADFILRHEVGGAGGGPIPVVGAVIPADKLKELTDADLATLERLAQKLARDPDPGADPGGES